jgi:hypothetical protein
MRTFEWVCKGGAISERFFCPILKKKQKQITVPQLFGKNKKVVRQLYGSCFSDCGTKLKIPSEITPNLKLP